MLVSCTTGSRSKGTATRCSACVILRATLLASVMVAVCSAVTRRTPYAAQRAHVRNAFILSRPPSLRLFNWARDTLNSLGARSVNQQWSDVRDEKQSQQLYLSGDDLYVALQSGAGPTVLERFRFPRRRQYQLAPQYPDNEHGASSAYVYNLSAPKKVSSNAPKKDDAAPSPTKPTPWKRKNGWFGGNRSNSYKSTNAYQTSPSYGSQTSQSQTRQSSQVRPFSSQSAASSYWSLESPRIVVEEPRRSWPPPPQQQTNKLYAAEVLQPTAPREAGGEGGPRKASEQPRVSFLRPKPVEHKMEPVVVPPSGPRGQSDGGEVAVDQQQQAPRKQGTWRGKQRGTKKSSTAASAPAKEAAVTLDASSSSDTSDPIKPAELVEVRGVVKRITFTNGENGFTVIRVESEEDKSMVTMVGNFPCIHVGATVAVKGEWTKNKKYGKQLQVREYLETAPATQAGIENYLASGLVRGIGPVAAKQIVAHFGLQTLHVLNEEPGRLTEVEGIGKKKAEMIRKAWHGQREVTNVMLFLQTHNVSTVLATKIYKAYGNKSIEVVQRDPYQLADEMVGIGFRIVDKIAHQLGFDRQSPNRYRCGLLHLLKEQANEGHCYGIRTQVLRDGARLLGAPIEDLNGILEEMISRGEVIQRPIKADTSRTKTTAKSSSSRGSKSSSQHSQQQQQTQALFLPFFDMYESETALRIRAMAGSKPTHVISKDTQARALGKAERSLKMKFDDVQLEAITRAAESRFLVLTGGPGTGKTTTALGIISLFREQGMDVALAAPTGRAAQRLTEATGLEAKTLHRLLEYSPETKSFKRGAGNKLECDVLIVDEASMVDITLMYHVLAALPLTCTVVLVGDVDQLPPVGPGNVLRDIIESDKAQVVRLTRIFRQAQESGIVVNAHRINRGELPDFKRREEGKENDFFIIEVDDPARAIDLVQELCTRRLPKHYNLDPIADIQVLCPMKKGEVGTLQLNSILQKALNPSNPSIKYGGTEFRLGDKVMQVKNNYEKNVFNGGTGTITDVKTADKSLVVTFEGLGPVTYDATELDQIMLAYAATVHKAQGSEYRVVVAPLLHQQHGIMLQRNLLYTCVTRAKEVLVLVGTKEAVARAVKNDKPQARNSMLRERLLEAKSTM